jgi:hypothetical protein
VPPRAPAPATDGRLHRDDDVAERPVNHVQFRAQPQVSLPPASVRPAPPRAQLVGPVFTIRPGWAVGRAFVATAAVTLALVGVWRLFDTQSAVTAVAGAMAVLFARGEPYVHRARTVVAFGLLVIAMSGAAVVASKSDWYLLGAVTVMAGVAG